MDGLLVNRKLLIGLVIGTVTFLKEIGIDLKPWREGATCLTGKRLCSISSPMSIEASDGGLNE
jgi:hypothetical protein